MRIVLLILPIFLFLGCNKTSQVDLRSIPEGAKIYDTKSKKFIAKTPAELTYVFDNDPMTPECEIIPPITAVWNGYNAIITEKNIMICPDKNYKIVINQHTFREPIKYKVIEYKEEGYFIPYIGVDIISSSIDVDIAETNVSNNNSSYLYKLGFIDKQNNRLELNYTTLEFDEKDLNLYSLDTIISISKLKDKNAEPYFKFGFGYANYTYNNIDYTNPMYTLGFGLYGYLSENIEVDLGLSTKSHLNYGSIFEGIGFNGVEKPESRINLTNIVMGMNYKF